MARPAYWDKLQFSISKSGYLSALLPDSSYEYKAIAEYLIKNAAKETLKAPQGERTRMVRAQQEIRRLINLGDNLSSDDHAKFSTHLKTLLEAKDSYIDNDIRPFYAKYGIKIKKINSTESGNVEISKIYVVNNADLWRGYDAARLLIKQEIANSGKPSLTTGGKLWGRMPLSFTTSSKSGLIENSSFKLPVIDPDAGELLLMHGTAPAVIDIIANNGFNPSFNQGTIQNGVTKYGALGQGTYFGDSFAKVQTYTGCPRCCAMRCACVDEDGGLLERKLLLARCLIGVPTKARTHDSRRQDSVNTIKDGKHSVVGQKRGLFANWTFFGSNEFLIKEKNQMYPEFIVHWRPA